MPRPASRTRILSVGVGSTALVAALALAVGPSSDIGSFGPLGRAEPSAAGATASVEPQAFGIRGVDLAALGYSGPDLSATTLASLNEPLAGLPTERAADVRERLGAATPHLRGLHQAKNLLGKAATKQDHHVYAAKVAAAKAEQARIEAERRLEEAIAAATQPAAPAAPEGDARTGTVGDAVRSGAALASVTSDHGATSAARRDGDAPAAAEAPKAEDQPSAGGGAEKGAGQDAAPAPAKAGKADGAKGASKGGDAADKPGRGAGGAEAPAKDAKAADDGGAGAGKAPAATPEAERPVATPSRPTAATDDAEGTRSDAVEPPAAGDGGSQAAQELVRKALEVERLAAEAAQARAVAADQWRQLEERRERRRALRAAAEAAEAELTRFDDHVRWLHTVLSKAQSSMLTAGGRIVAEARGGAEVPIVEVRGFKVHASLEHSIRQLVDEAAAAGIDLEGKAYRPVSRQIELRKQNCGQSEYDIFEKPSSLCSPPTAIPGRSLHEHGLAVDFMNGENSITSRSDPAFRWLAEHAPSYGLFNLPAEPWHWSVTSQ